ncbi:sensor domain-containing diguanylate cyclase [Thermodesulfobacterium thermophilum]|uniref:sensor domain-containing diguanylate cyclase n=1 Tax=Thermodesulfobacterium thermophilum TaxID=886 RepID=UPI0009DB70B2|nr:sensor domain-containing diguanylate cyclase [Thermodesulfobacterium thermophilum]
MYNSTLYSMKELPSLYAQGIGASQTIKNIFKTYKDDEEILRKKLYQFLFPFIQNLVSLQIDLHFHNQKGRSLLKFYNPSVYGEDLTQYREDVAYVIKYKKPVFGFSTGKMLSGFRNTFPLLDERGDYLGGVDFIISLKHFEKLVYQLNPGACFRLIFKKKETVDKLEEKYRSMFASRFFGEDLVEYQRIFNNDDLCSKALNVLQQDLNFRKSIFSDKPKILEFNRQNKVYEIVSMPIKDFKEITVGFLVVTQRAETVEGLYKEFYRNVYIYTLLLLLILFISFYTNRKARESFLERKKFNTVIQFMESAVYTVKDFKINFVNPKLLKLLGYSEEELIGKRDHEGFVDPVEDRCAICEAISKGEEFTGDMVLKKKDGSYLIANVKVSHVRDELGKVVETVVCFWDITLRKKLEDALYLNSITDPLTRLFNRRFIATVLENLKEKASESKQTFSVIMIDIDNFKRINDVYGHDVGDEVLKVLAETLIGQLRDQDIVGRWGGEEFIVVLPETDLKNAILVAEKLRKAVEDLEIGIHRLKITISLGVSEYRLKEKEEIADLIKRADSALYLAKRSGKNCVKFET